MGTGPISFMSFLAGYTLGDNTANRVTPFQASELPKIDSIARVDILLGGSGAIDNLEFVPVKVPEPGTLALLASTAALWVQRRRSA